MPGQPGASFLSVKIARAEQGASCFPVSGKCPEHKCSELKGGAFAVKWLNTAPVRVRGVGDLLPRALGASTVTVVVPKAPVTGHLVSVKSSCRTKVLLTLREQEQQYLDLCKLIPQQYSIAKSVRD